MKFIVIGLGNFGISLSTTLYELGHEVIGIDSRDELVQEYKDRLTGTVCLNSTIETALASQPICEVDAVIVAIGEDWAASIQTAALLKKRGVKRIIGRSLADLHEVVLGGLGITEIINPELTAAKVIANHIISKKVIHTLNLTDDISINEIEIPKIFVDQTVKDIDLKMRYDLTLMAVKHGEEQKSILPGVPAKTVWKVICDVPDDYRFAAGDHIVVSGDKTQMGKMLDLIK